MSDPLLPARFLFRFAAACRYKSPLWTPQGAALDETFRLPDLGELEGHGAATDFRVAWSEAGLALAARVAGKTQPPWCRASRSEDSDGVQVWLDTRDVHNVHRAGRFCHRFIFLPGGGGQRLDEPVALWLPIHRAREEPRPIGPGQVQIRSEKGARGYFLEAFLPAEVLTGFDPQEHPRLGFTYAVIDRELGEQTFGVGSPLPYQEDPSLWATLEMVR